MTKQKLAQTRAGQTRGLGSRSRRHRPPRERWEEARGGRRPRPTMEDPSPDDAGQKTVRRSRRAGRDEGGSRTLRRSAGGCTKRLGAAGTRGTMWKTASASPPSGGRPRLVADHTHKEPCTKTAGRGPVPFYPSPSRGVRFIYLFTGCFIREEPPRCRLSFPRESWRKEGASCTPAGLPDQSSPTKDKNEERTLECTHTHPR